MSLWVAGKFSMIGALKRRFLGPDRDRKAYDRACAGILNTPPLDIKDAPLRFLSMMCHRDIIPYLVAIKSLYSRIGEGRVVIVDDGTLTGEDRSVLDHHLGGVEYAMAADIPVGACPRGGCWERLLAIVDRLSGNYVVQVDADTVTLGAVDEIAQLYSANQSFTLGTPRGSEIASLSSISPLVREWIEDQGIDTLQVQAEALFEQLPNADERRYVRGSAGFAGFAKGSVTRNQAEDFSQEVEAALGPRWHDWGSEQVASNYLIANAPDAVVLPQPKYSCYQPNIDPTDAAFLHFFGTYRYDGGLYQRLSETEIRRLMPST